MIVHPPRALIASWRKQAMSIVTNPESTTGQREVAWAFLRQHGVAGQKG